ncbi:MAG: hypothetical protein ACI30W_05970, partial [Muribaculaceae bacterium]
QARRGDGFQPEVSGGSWGPRPDGAAVAWLMTKSERSEHSEHSEDSEDSEGAIAVVAALVVGSEHSAPW